MVCVGTVAELLTGVEVGAEESVAGAAGAAGTGADAPVGRVFISYAHDDAAHEERVRNFWIFLRSCGIDAVLDLPAAERRLDWAQWMTRQIRDAGNVLVIASPQYKLRAEGDAGPETGRGVQWEAGLIRERMYKDQAAGLELVLPVVLPGCSPDDIPLWLRPHSTTYYHIAELTDGGADRLIRVLTDQPWETDPPLGPRRTRPARSHELPQSVDRQSAVATTAVPLTDPSGSDQPPQGTAFAKGDPQPLLIGELISRLDLENWDGHVGGLLRTSKGMYSSSRARLLSLAIWLNGLILPSDQEELKRILSTLQNVITDLIGSFDLHSEAPRPDQDDLWLRTAQFYKTGGWRPSRHEEVELYNSHVNLISDLAFELTRVVNWLCDFVRREFDPVFRLQFGAVQVEGGPFLDGDTRWFRPEYSAEELSKPRNPYMSLESFKTERYTRDFHTMP